MPIDISFRKYSLSNGLDVILHEDHTVPVVAVNIWYHVGSQNEEPDRTGFAHLFEHIMFKGSKHHNREYFMPLQEIGANVNGSTSTDRTNYYENVPPEYLALALWLESDRMGYLLDALDEASFAVEREVVKNERRQSYENRPYGLASQEIRKALFPPNHPYHWQTIGSQEHLDSASVEDVKAFFRRFYAPNNASLCIAGDIDPDEATALVERYFGNLTPGPSVPRIQRWIPELDGEVRLTLEDRVQLQRIYLSWPGPPRFHADEAPLDILVAILSEGRSSRLYRSLVYDKQLARDVNARFDAMEIAGEIRLDATVVPGGDVHQAERALLAELDRMKIHPPQAEELQRAVNRLEASNVRQLESVGGFGGRADLLNYFNVFTGDPGQLNHDFDRYQRVTAEDVTRVARHYFGDGRVRLVISPKQEVSQSALELDRYQQPGPSSPRTFHPPVPTRVHLAGGIDLLAVQKHDLPMIAAAFSFPGGALSDPIDAPGLSSFTTRLLTEGTASRSSQQIAEESDFIAARLGVSVHRENVSSSTEVLARHWPKALDLVTDMLTNPVFADGEVERVRKERLTDLRRLRDDANAIASRVSNGILYGIDTPYGHPTGGLEASIAALGRDQLVAQHQRIIRHQRPTVILVGDVDPDAIGHQIETALGAWQGDEQQEGPVGIPATRRPSTIYLVDKPGAAQSVISAGQLNVSRHHPDYLALVVMNMAFGGQFTARLNMNLREEKGYTYGYRSGFEWRLNHSTFSAGGAVQTAVTKEALFETLKEFRDLHANRPLTQEEFDKARLGLIRGYPPSFETPSQILGRLSDIVHYGLPDDYYTGQIERLQAVTLADVQRVAAEHIDPEQLSITVVGDRSVIESGLQELGLPIIHIDFEGHEVS